MTKKLKNFFLLIIAILIIVVSFIIKNQAGKLFLVPLIIGTLIALYSLIEIFSSPKKETQGPTEPQKVPPSYKRKTEYLSRSEMELYLILNELFGKNYEVFTQVALVSVIDKLTQNSFRNELFRIIDFMLADKNTFSPLILIELNDASHLRADRAERDKKVNEICAAAGLPLVTFTLNDLRDVINIKETIQNKILK